MSLATLWAISTTGHAAHNNMLPKSPKEVARTRAGAEIIIIIIILILAYFYRAA